jgi:hypothetical protein
MLRRLWYWLRGMMVSEPSPIEFTKGGDPFIPGLELSVARRRFRTALEEWRDGRRSCDSLHQEMNLLARSISRRCLSLRELQSQEAYDFFNLAGEVAEATRFEPSTRWIAEVALELERTALGNLYGSRRWGEIVAKRGPIESFSMKRCRRCSTEFPSVGTSGFLMMTFLWCKGCGKVLGQVVASKEGARAIEPYDERTATEQSARAAKLGVPWRRCACGGTIHSLHRCPGCGSTEMEHEFLPSSAFFYFESHQYDELERQPVQDTGTATEGK